MCLLARRVKKEVENKNIKRKNSRDIYRYMVLNIQKQFLESGRNSAM